jgi:hypothetical protein
MTTSTSPPPPPPPQPNQNSNIANIIVILIIIASIPFAVYLSWSCNTGLGISKGLKIIYAICAGLGNVGYLLFYFIYRLGICGPWAQKPTSGLGFGGKKRT